MGPLDLRHARWRLSGAQDPIDIIPTSGAGVIAARHRGLARQAAWNAEDRRKVVRPPSPERFSWRACAEDFVGNLSPTRNRRRPLLGAGCRSLGGVAPGARPGSGLEHGPLLPCAAGAGGNTRSETKRCGGGGETRPQHTKLPMMKHRRRQGVGRALYLWAHPSHPRSPAGGTPPPAPAQGMEKSELPEPAFLGMIVVLVRGVAGRVCEDLVRSAERTEQPQVHGSQCTSSCIAPAWPRWR